MSGKNYHDEIKRKNIIKLREVLKELPPFLDAFFRANADTKAAATRLAYAEDLRLFFRYLTEYCDEFEELLLKDFTIDNFKEIKVDHIERFMEYLSYYTVNVNGEEISYQNDGAGKTTKLAAIRTMFKYFYKKQIITTDPSLLVDFPKLHNKPITYLEVDEIARLLDEVESGQNLLKKEQEYHQKTKERDLAIITLILGTGMRISECVGIDITHIDFNINAVRVTRKGGDEAILYFGEEVRTALLNYLELRNNIETVDGHENALFLSTQRKRIGTRAIQKLVKKYASLVTNAKKITPHKLRATFATTLYQETNDIFLVADILGHSDVNTTTKHYASMSEERRRKAANIVKLRDN